MNTLKVALCFLDHNDKPVVIKPLKSNWSVELGGGVKITERSYRDKMRDEIAEILADQIKMEISPDILKEMFTEF